MSKPLKIKDPIFGYIEIEDENFIAVVNSAMFQRLRDIVQTSYPSVYPFAVHNRFTHSLGVYYLGKIAQKSLSKDIKRLDLAAERSIDDLSKTFLLACLMHDLGHSPFSHTGEKFYFKEKGENGQPLIWLQLLNVLDDKDFISDLHGKDMVGAEHEIMSAYVSIVNYPEIFNHCDKSFFTRCIIGLTYSDKSEIRNCFIDLLNSKTIDVDKLDYLIRDSFATGFKSISIDHVRLLNSVCVIKDKDQLVQGFSKSALSTLESVILAHDMERKWIQNHPVIKYEGHLVAYMIAKVQSEYEQAGIQLFSADSLTEGGVTKGDTKICLLADSDINAYAKRYYGEDSKITEYFARGKRKKPLWKSESEYRFYFENAGVNDEVLTKLEDRFASLEKALVQQFEFPLINEYTLAYFKKEVAEAHNLPKQISEVKIRELEKTIGLIEVLQEYSKEYEFDFDYVVASVSQFKTGFNKEELQNIRVCINDKKSCLLKKVLHLFHAEKPRENYFYLFVDPVVKQKINAESLAQKIANYVLKEHQNE